MNTTTTTEIKPGDVVRPALWRVGPWLTVSACYKMFGLSEFAIGTDHGTFEAGSHAEWQLR